ncbi:hypothetical protein HDV05_000524 [Chytridiales sp. JEL 0842]|nr:hypothetical protein HDV05_000524 [Chytridiales sp. JEL 0842]
MTAPELPLVRPSEPAIAWDSNSNTVDAIIDQLTMPERLPPPPAAPYDIPELMKAANDGDVSAQLTLGLLLKNSGGGSSTVDQAAKWISMAGLAALKAIDSTEPLKDPSQIASSSAVTTPNTWNKTSDATFTDSEAHLEALYHLAKLHLDGIGVPYDPNEAHKLLSIAANRKHLPSTCLLGKLMADGLVKAYQHSNRLKKPSQKPTLNSISQEIWSKLSGVKSQGLFNGNSSTAVTSASHANSTVYRPQVVLPYKFNAGANAMEALQFLNTVLEDTKKEGKKPDPMLLEALAHAHLVLAQESATSIALSSIIPFIPIDSMLSIPKIQMPAMFANINQSNNMRDTHGKSSGRSKCHAERAVQLLREASQALVVEDPTSVTAAWKYGTCLLDGTASVKIVAEEKAMQGDANGGGTGAGGNTGSGGENSNDSLGFGTIQRTLRKVSSTIIPRRTLSMSLGRPSKGDASENITLSTNRPISASPEPDSPSSTTAASSSGDAPTHLPSISESKNTMEATTPEPPSNASTTTATSTPSAAPDKDSVHHQHAITYIAAAAHIASSPTVSLTNNFDPASLYIWGECLCRGMGVDQDVEAGSAWVLRAAMLGFAPAQVAVGRWAFGCFDEEELEHDEDESTGVKLDSEGKLHVDEEVKLRGSGDGDKKKQKHPTDHNHPKDFWFERNEKLATEWFLRAAVRGDIEGMMWLGKCYREGIGLPRDDAQAKKWFEAALVRLRDRDPQAALTFWKRWGKDMKNTESRPATEEDGEGRSAKRGSGEAFGVEGRARPAPLSARHRLLKRFTPMSYSNNLPARSAAVNL